MYNVILTIVGVKFYISQMIDEKFMNGSLTRNIMQQKIISLHRHIICSLDIMVFRLEIK